MRKTLLLLFLLMLYVSPASASHAFVACSNSCTNFNTGTTSLNIPASGTNTFTAGNLLWLSIRAGHGITINTPTSSPTETWTCRPTLDPGVGLSTITACYAWNIGGGSYTVTVTTSASTNLHLAIDEYSGTPTTCDPTQGSQVTTTAPANTTVTSNTVTTTGTTSLIVSSGIGTNTTGWTPGSNMTQRASINTGRVGTEDRLNVAAGSYTPSQTESSTNTDWAMVVSVIIQACPAASGQGVSKSGKLEKIDP